MLTVAYEARRLLVHLRCFSCYCACYPEGSPLILNPKAYEIMLQNTDFALLIQGKAEENGLEPV